MKTAVASHIVVLHGWTLDPAVTERWQPFLKLLEQAGLTVHFWPLPGLAVSANQSYTLPDYVAWLKQKTASLDSFVLLGHSFGGQLAIRFTKLHPAKVSQLILINSAGMLDTFFPKTLKRSFFKALAKFGKAFTQSPVLKKLLYRLARETNYYEANNAQQITMRAILADEIKEDLAAITVPTLIIWGRHDTLTPLRLGQVFTQGIAGAKLVVIANARHAPMYTNSQEVLEVIQTFLKV